MTKKKKRWSDRRDGRMVRDLDGMHILMPHIMPNRCDCEAFISEQIDLTAVNAYLDQKNADDPEYRYRVFHVIAAAAVKAFTLRPKMNRFLAGRRTYERDLVSLAFIAKKEFSDHSEEAMLFMEFDGDTTIDTVNQRIYQKVKPIKQGANDHSTDVMNILKHLPRPLLRFTARLIRILDHYGRLPQVLVREVSDYASIFISNLGSIKLNAGYHHLNNWGTNSVFIVIGQQHPAPYYDANGNVEMRESLNLGITLDERIADGYYFAKIMKLLQYLFAHPELLDLPAKEEVPYDN